MKKDAVSQRAVNVMFEWATDRHRRYMAKYPDVPEDILWNKVIRDTEEKLRELQRIKNQNNINPL